MRVNFLWSQLRRSEVHLDPDSPKDISAMAAVAAIGLQGITFDLKDGTKVRVGYGIPQEPSG